MVLPAQPNPGSPTIPQANLWYLQLLSAEAESTAKLMQLFRAARLELEQFIRTGDLTASDAAFYRSLLAETNRIAGEVQADGTRFVSSTLQDAYAAGWGVNAITVVPRGALEALSREPLHLIRDTTEMMRERIRMAIGTSMLEALPSDAIRQRLIMVGLQNIPHWPSVEYRAGVIARTETMRAFNAGIIDGITDNGARYVRWIASPDEATCPICLPRDGKVFRLTGEPIDDDPYPAAPILDRPPAHPRCRCTIRAEYRGPDGEVLGTPPKTPDLEPGTMGADHPPEIPWAAGDLRKAWGRLDADLREAIVTESSYRNLIGTSFDSPKLRALYDPAAAKVTPAREFWRAVDIDDEFLRWATRAGQAGWKERMDTFTRLRYGFGWEGSASGWSGELAFRTLRMVERIRASFPRYVVDSDYLTAIGGEPIGGVGFKDPRVIAHAYASGQVNANLKVISKYQYGAVRLGPDVHGYEEVMLHELAHTIHNRYGLNVETKFGTKYYAPVEWGDDWRAAETAFRSAWADIRANTQRSIAPNSHDVSAIRDQAIADLETMRQYMDPAGYAVLDEQIAKIRTADSPVIRDYWPTEYARESYGEDFAESVTAYFLDNTKLRLWSPARWKFLNERVFGGWVP